MALKTPESEPLTAAGVFNQNGCSSALIVCEHASNHVPSRFGNLGLSRAALDSHIAWDPGAAEVAKLLSAHMDAACLLGTVSRLVYDCNRPPEAEDAIPEKSEIYQIPGNTRLSEEERNDRVNSVYRPFRETVESHVKRSRALITIHSFTPVYQGKNRDVELGILHDADSRLADQILNNSQQHTCLRVCRNEPYGPEHGVMHTLGTHGVPNSIPNVMIEIRNSLIATPEACEDIARQLYNMVSQGLENVMQQDGQIDCVEKCS